MHFHPNSITLKSILIKLGIPSNEQIKFAIMLGQQPVNSRITLQQSSAFKEPPMTLGIKMSNLPLLKLK